MSREHNIYILWRPLVGRPCCFKYVNKTALIFVLNFIFYVLAHKTNGMSIITMEFS